MSEASKPRSEAEVIARSAAPLTTVDVLTALRSAGVTEGETIIAHSSLSRLGWVVGGAQTIVQGLLAAVGQEGTVVMPAHTGISDPSSWENPPVPESWWEAIRQNWPAFDPILTPLRGMGAVVECFRRLPDVGHSGHPAVAFVARGPEADGIVADHPLEHSLADSSPLGSLYTLGARIVLLGVGHENNTSLHLAEHRASYEGKRTKIEAAPLIVDGTRQWHTYRDLDRDDADFPKIAAAFVSDGGHEQRATLGTSQVITCEMRAIVDYATRWISANR